MAGAVRDNRLDPAELLDSLRGMLWGCWRYRWPAIALVWAICLVGWLICMLIPDVHRASTRVYVDTQSTLRPLLQGLAVNTDVLDDVGMMERAIMSRPNLERLARDADMDILANDPSSFDALITRLQASIKLNRDGKNIVQISYENTDPRKALAVVTALLNNFIEGSLGETRTDSSTAEKFLVEKLKDYEARLNDAEAKLAEFKRKNVGVMPEEGADYYDRLQAESAELQLIDGKLRVARNRRAELQRQIEGEEPVFGLVPADDAASLTVTAQDRQIAEFERQLAELRLKYTDTHPDIVSIRKTLEELQREKTAAAAKATGGGRRAYSPLDLNPVYQQMKLQLSQVDVELAQLQAEYSDQAGVVGGLRRKVDIIPAIEAELKRLTRDYDVTKTQYDELLQRVETARLSEAAEQSKSDITFRIIDPPTVPSLPVGPNRPLLITVVLLFALVAGAGLAMALNLLQPVFYTGKDLERRFGVPVLGSIRLVRSDMETALVRHKTRLVLASLAGLVLCYGVLLVLGVVPLMGEGGLLSGALGL
jgi:polysaccharide chain length determinant protein (PEP-CTERM system associated)